jgi:hypothetical protein
MRDESLPVLTKIIFALAILGALLASSGAAASSASQGLPTVPQEFLVVAKPGHLLLTWKPPVSDGGSAITGYNVYRDTAKGGAKPVLATVSPSENLSYEDRAVFEGVPYYYQLSAVNADGEGPITGELSGTALPGIDKPNLRVARIEVSPARPVPGELMEIDVTVENRGGGRAPPALVRVQVDGGLLVERLTTALPAGAAAVVHSSLVISAGSHSISAFIDPSNEIAEPDELDNYAIRNFTVAESSQGVEPYLLWLAAFVAAVTSSVLVAAAAMMMWKRKGPGHWRKRAAKPPAVAKK